MEKEDKIKELKKTIVKLEAMGLPSQSIEPIRQQLQELMDDKETNPEDKSGDQISVGNVGDNSAVATGRYSARFVNNTFNFLTEIIETEADALRAYATVLAEDSGISIAGRITDAGDAMKQGQEPMMLSNVFVGLNTKTAVAVEKLNEALKTNNPLLLQNKPDELTHPKEEKEEEKRTFLSTLQAARLFQRLVLTGDPGCGKSTLVNQLTYCLAQHQLNPKTGWLSHLPDWDETDLIPVPVILREFGAFYQKDIPQKATAKHLWLFLKNKWDDQLQTEKARKYFQKWLQNGRFLFLLDGLDELPSIELRIFVRDAIEAFVKVAPKNRYLVTCRVLAYQPPADKDQIELRLPINGRLHFPDFEINGFSEKQIDQFITIWYEELVRIKTVPSSDKERLIDSLKKAIRRSDLREFASNPLLLSIMAIVHANEKELPDARAVLYKLAVDMFLSRWDRISGREEQLRNLLRQAGLDTYDLKRVFGRLAFDVHQQKLASKDSQGLANIDELTLLKTLAKLNNNDRNWATEIIKTVKLRAGLLLEKEESIFTFPHRTFQEYLAGSFLMSQQEFAKTAAELVDRQALWREVILLAVGELVHDKGELERPLALIQKLCPRKLQDDDLSWRKVWLAGELLEEIGIARARGEAEDIVDSVRDALGQLVSEGKLTPRERHEASLIADKLGWLPPDLNSWLSCPDCAENGGQLMAMKYPVTNAQFELFIKAGGYDEPKYWIDHETETKAEAEQSKGWQWRNSEQKVWNVEWIKRVTNEPGLWQNGRFGKERRVVPVVGVSWYEANAYGNWLTALLKQEELELELEALIKDLRGKVTAVRLPKDVEWSALAGGDQENRFPWHPKGEAQKKIIEADVVAHANVDESGIGQTSVVGMYPNGRSPYGLMDMSGNVFEWSYSWSDNDKDRRVLRGGSWNYFIQFARVASRGINYPHNSDYYLGFRLVAPVVPVS